MSENTLPQEIVEPVDGQEQQLEIEPGNQEEVGEVEHTEPEKKKNGIQKRISKLAQERDYWKDKALEAESKVQETTPATEPKLSDFESYNDYEEALIDWKADKKAAEKLARTKEESLIQEKVASYTKGISELEKKYEDLRETLAFTDSEPFFHSKDIQEFCLEAGPEFVYQLLKSDEVERLEKMSPARRLAELGKLEDKFSKVETKKVEPEKVTTKAPAKVSNLNGTAAAPLSRTEAAKSGSYAEWVKARNEELKSKRR